MVDKVGLSSTSVVGNIGVGFINYIFLKVFLLTLCTHTLTFDLSLYTQLHLSQFLFSSLFVYTLLSSLPLHTHTHARAHTHT